MNYALRWVGAYICYYLGDWISRLDSLPEWCGAWWWYPAYNWLMLTSSDLDHDDLGIWEPYVEDDDAKDK